MKHNKQQANYFISYDNNAPTSWVTLTLLIVAFWALFVYLSNQPIHIVYAAEIAVPEAEVIEDSKSHKYDREGSRQAFLRELRWCESTNDDYAVGDGGDSVGPYQWQKETYEDKIGRKVSYDEYYAAVTDYEYIHELTYKTYYEDSEWWRWENCTYKISG